ncbi:MAG: chemotaxis protein CheA [Clostridiales bacterium]|jgi:two-component system chemotaxis sensor kinase CheA|nr:chemotaxis protein CheA [Clostridiales bacterium]
MAVDNSLMDMFVFETTQLIDQLENILIDSENNGISGNIDEIFRIMHTIKGSAAMMMFDDISHLAHSIEDLFFFLREKNPTNVDYAKLTDLVLDGMDFIKNEIDKIQQTGSSDAKSDQMRETIRQYLEDLKAAHEGGAAATVAGAGAVGAAAAGAGAAGRAGSADASGSVGAGGGDDVFSAFEFSTQEGFAYVITVRFEDGSGMEHLRAFELVNRLQNISTELRHIPSDIDGETAMDEIQKNGVTIIFASELEHEDVVAYIEQTALMKTYDVKVKALKRPDDAAAGAGADSGTSADAGIGSAAAASPAAAIPAAEKPEAARPAQQPAAAQGGGGDSGGTGKQGIISVNISKLDKLMNLVGELVTSESMVSQNPDLNGLQLDNFNKAARQLQKIINELQDVSMSVRMVPLSLTFQKMHRIVRDMCRKLGKEVNLEIIGEETEVDKNIIEQITNPLMHLIRNSVDHGIEMPDDRERAGKRRSGTVTLEAKNESGDVWIIVKDDGQGLDKSRIYEKARRNGLTSKSREELTDKEINSFILAAGFSTNEQVTEYSGRGVGMDVVVKGIETVGGSVMLDSSEGAGTQISIKIPLTLAIMEGMIVNVGATNFVIPITSIRESFKANERHNIADVNGEDIIMIRGEPNPIIRLRDRFSLNSKAESYYDGIMIMVENETRQVCLYVDAILGQRQVVVKPLPGYIKEVRGISGCTLLGDGSISLILDVAEFLL